MAPISLDNRGFSIIKFDVWVFFLSEVLFKFYLVYNYKSSTVFYIEYTQNDFLCTVQKNYIYLYLYVCNSNSKWQNQIYMFSLS